MLTHRLARHLPAALAAAAAITPSSSGAIISWFNANLIIPATIDGLYINVETRTTGSAGSVTPGWDINP